MSENYRALTRKYRPHTFEDIVSQEHVSNTIQNAIKQNRLSHAYMFCGPRGVGKTTMARVLARTINEIDSSVDGESLNTTLNIVEMDAASNNKVDDVHHLRESVRIPPQNGRYKVFIVDEVHMLSKAAFNALLKTLEEPPEHAIFIFATTEPHKVLPTILSRVQRFDFKRIAVEEIVHRLRNISLDEDISIDEESLHVIAKKADGALRDALGLMDQAIAFCGDTITHDELLQALNVVGAERLFEFMDCVKQKDADAGLSLIDTLLQEGYDIQEFLIGLAEHIRNLYIAHHSEQLYLVEASAETKKRYKASAPDFTRDDLMRMLHIISEAQIKLKDASQPRIQFEITLLKLIHMERTEQLEQLLKGLDELKKNSGSFVNGLASPAKDKKELESSPEAVNDQAEAADTVSPEKEETSTPQPEEQKVSQMADEEVPREAAVESESAPEEEVIIEEPQDDEFDLGRPALETDLSRRIKLLDKKEAEEHKPKAKPGPVQSEETPHKKVTIEDVQEVWDVYLESIKGEFPMLLHLQMERAKVEKVKGAQLYIACDNEFAKNMLDEQSKELSRKLKECLGCFLRFEITVSKSSEQKKKTQNPYERFKELQQKDPLIRDIVELFGAELEY
ncbi:MAG: DNA polymerase III subunit gamma/tau [Balneolaceae bacterium]|nr:DNA polymerase III subunit gamma/tau [Balneolaceae bacterium]